MHRWANIYWCVITQQTFLSSLFVSAVAKSAAIRTVNITFHNLGIIVCFLPWRWCDGKSKQSLKEVPFADKSVLLFNTIVFLFSSLQAKADVRRDYGAFIASKYRFRSAKKTACKHDYFRPVILCCYTDFLTPRAEKNNILTNNPFVVVSGLENILLEITALTSTLLLTRKA